MTASSHSVLFLTNSHSGGGAERSSNLVANALVDLGCTVHLVAINESENDVIEQRYSSTTLGRHWGAGFASTFGAFRKFQGQVKKFNPSVIILVCELAELFGSLMLRKSIIIVDCQTNYPWGRRQILGRIVRGILKIRRAVWISSSNHFLIWPDSSRPNQVINNPIIDSPEFYGSAESISNQIRRIAFIGRLSAEKQPLLALQIAKSVELPIIIIGEGELLEDLKTFARQNQVEATFKGFVKLPWLELSDGDLLIVPSLFEGDGLVVIESLMANRPIVLSDISDFRRFGLPDRNYAAGLNGFCESVILYRTDIQALKVSENTRMEILSSRDYKQIGLQWKSVVENLSYLNEETKYN